MSKNTVSEVSNTNGRAWRPVVLDLTSMLSETMSGNWLWDFHVLIRWDSVDRTDRSEPPRGPFRVFKAIARFWVKSTEQLNAAVLRLVFIFASSSSPSCPSHEYWRYARKGKTTIITIATAKIVRLYVGRVFTLKYKKRCSFLQCS